ncbi:hypothetical protein AGMMS49982_14330 [Bacteroidia bacterium]|nr:hypothetical protein AGMMS49982_14330 [Bacteroidia bacterium]
MFLFITFYLFLTFLFIKKLNSGVLHINNYENKGVYSKLGNEQFELILKFIDMVLFKQMEQLERIHKAIGASHTGSSASFAEKLGISKRRLHEIIDEMKSRGAPIAYSRTAETYYYTQAVEATLACSFTCLSRE